MLQEGCQKSQSGVGFLGAVSKGIFIRLFYSLALPMLLTTATLGERIMHFKVVSGFWTWFSVT